MAKAEDKDEAIISAVMLRRENGDAYEIYATRLPEGDWKISQGDDAEEVIIYLPDDKAMDNFIAGIINLRKLQKQEK